LAAGEGLRLRPLTANKPKCLLSLNGKPLLGYWLDHCQRGGISEVLINGYYLADQVASYLEKIKDKYSFKIYFVREKKLLGTGGTIKKNYNFIRNEEFFFFFHGDNFTDIDIVDFICFHKKKKGLLSIALFKTETPEQCGIVEVITESGMIEKFIEKPIHSVSNLASAAIFLLSPKIIINLPEQKNIDFSKDILPLYQGRMYGYYLKGYNVDIGTPKRYIYANKIAGDLKMRNL